jgi:hypothetical protein
MMPSDLSPTESFDPPSALATSDELRPEDLPPIEPPSAGFIVQLFIVPALIVVAVIGVWALFGKLASSEQDHRTLIRELNSSNEHRRWRAALSLAQMLKSDLDQGADGRGLTRNREIATELTSMLDDRLTALLPGDKKEREQALKHQEFLSRSLGMLDVNEIVLPVLQRAMDVGQDREVRKNSIAAIALIAGRNETAGEPMTSPEVVESLVTATNDSDVLIRQMGTYALGLMQTDKAEQRLVALLKNSDQNTRYNAAIGLVRRKSPGGLPVFQEVLEQAGEPEDSNAIAAMDEEQQSEFRQRKEFLEPVMLLNTLKAVEDLSDQLEPEQHTTMILLVRKIADSYPNAEVRVNATRLLLGLEKETPAPAKE